MYRVTGIPLCMYLEADSCRSLRPLAHRVGLSESFMYNVMFPPICVVTYLTLARLHDQYIYYFLTQDPSCYNIVSSHEISYALVAVIIHYTLSLHVNLRTCSHIAVPSAATIAFGLELPQ